MKSRFHQCATECFFCCFFFLAKLVAPVQFLCSSRYEIECREEPTQFDTLKRADRSTVHHSILIRFRHELATGKDKAAVAMAAHPDRHCSAIAGPLLCGDSRTRPTPNTFRFAKRRQVHMLFACVRMHHIVVNIGLGIGV